METPRRTTDGPDGAGSPRQTEHNELALAAAGILAILGFAWAVQNYGRDDDRQAVLRQVREIEQRIRAHGPALWWAVEGNDSPGKQDPQQEARHQRILGDFERLAHLEDFEMADVVVEIRGADARASYGVRGRAAARERPPPARGEILFRREPSGWRLVDHRFLDGR